MPVGPDETEQLLAKLEAELAEHEAIVRERKEKEDAERERLELTLASWIVRRDDAEKALEKTTPQRNAMIQLRDHLVLNGSKGNLVRALTWSYAASVLLLGATVPLAMFSGQSGFFAFLLGELAALAAGYGIVAWLNRSEE